MLKRRIFYQVSSWAQGTGSRKPLLIAGARQVGKTYAVKQATRLHCRTLHVFNFEKSPQLAEIFATDLNPSRIIDRLALLSDQSILPEQDILFFDEIQACAPALLSLKYFQEDLPQMRVISSGSYIGLHLKDGFPVGKVDVLDMYPLTFEEYLEARLGETPLFQSFQSKLLDPILFDRIWPFLLEYFYVGGLPEAVQLWVQSVDKDVVAAARQVRQFQETILQSYTLDFGKYSGKNWMDLTAVFNAVPAQLNQAHENNVSKFKFSAIEKGKKGFERLKTPIHWLEEMRMIHRAPLVAEVKTPLLADPTYFRLFFFDMGLLSCQLNISLQSHMASKFEYKGFLAENFVALELKAQGLRGLFGWRPEKGDAEIEFILPVDQDITAIPIEVKSGRNTHSRSLEVYRKRFAPKASIKLVGSPGGFSEGLATLPLFYAGRVKEILQERMDVTLS